MKCFVFRRRHIPTHSQWLHYRFLRVEYSCVRLWFIATVQIARRIIWSWLRRRAPLRGHNENDTLAQPPPRQYCRKDTWYCYWCCYWYKWKLKFTTWTRMHAVYVCSVQRALCTHTIKAQSLHVGDWKRVDKCSARLCQCQCRWWVFYEVFCVCSCLLLLLSIVSRTSRERERRKERERVCISSIYSRIVEVFGDSSVVTHDENLW